MILCKDFHMKKMIKKLSFFTVFFGFISLILFFVLHIQNIRIKIYEIFTHSFSITINFNRFDSFLTEFNNYLLVFSFFFIAIFLMNKYKDNLLKLVARFSRIFYHYKWLKIFTIILIWILVLVLFVFGNINNPELWFDESGQFWMAKGLNHFSLPFTPNGNINDVLLNNAKYNLDPGGFTLLLHFWTMISNEPFFLRLLPLIFFILSMVLVSRLSMIWFPKNHFISYFAGFILLFSNLLKHYAFELRPYSMEMFTAILSLFLCYKIPLILKSKSYAITTGTLMAILLTSRYSTICTIFALGCMLFYQTFFKIRLVIVCLILYIFLSQY